VRGTHHGLEWVHTRVFICELCERGAMDQSVQAQMNVSCTQCHVSHKCEVGVKTSSQSSEATFQENNDIPCPQT